MLQQCRRAAQRLVLGSQSEFAALYTSEAEVSKRSNKKGDAKAASEKELVKKEVAGQNWSAVTLPSQTVKDLPITTRKGASFSGDLRSTSGLGMGDGLKTHTEKWLQGTDKSPMDWVAEAEPIKVHGAVVASYGVDDPSLGCPVEYINLKGSSRENPKFCKYTGNRYYSDDWASAH